MRTLAWIAAFVVGTAVGITATLGAVALHRDAWRSIPLSSDDLPRCRDVGTVFATQMSGALYLQDCDPRGLTVEFPDGTQMRAARIGEGYGLESSARPGLYYAVTSWGPGLSASVRGSGTVQAWGSTDDALQRELASVREEAGAG
ncbi:hypothetical protein [Aeromicrobium sp. IC_218]|uniref:hypothetical protein n=1 Tax=Aeromicrobium sp. IC_218 TaxID=2545468 RepID=UPI00103F7BF8|nr:hypothetical protein [Aeromicrobium sp. IC_218]TCJ00757.1 hypothetical protein E0W78_01340 [Aeromicrobium sp. IC_218]